MNQQQAVLIDLAERRIVDAQASLAMAGESLAGAGLPLKAIECRRVAKIVSTLLLALGPLLAKAAAMLEESHGR